jgi:hypothetical protein
VIQSKALKIQTVSLLSEHRQKNLSLWISPGRWITTAFSMRCSPKSWLDFLASLLLATSLAAASPLAQAQASAPDAPASAPQAPAQWGAVRADKTEDGIVLQAAVQLELGPAIVNALEKGVPLVFVWEAEVTRDRWYWTDRSMSRVQRIFRVAYQPLSRKWRVQTSVGNGSASSGSTSSGSGNALSQSYDSLAEVVSLISRVPRWRVLDAADVDADMRHRIELRFRLDVQALPRPLQIGVAGSSEWNIALERRVRVTMGSAP